MLRVLPQQLNEELIHQVNTQQLNNELTHQVNTLVAH